MKQSPLARKTPLARSPMKKRRSKRAQAKEFSSSVRQTVMERSQGMCELCGCKRGEHLHHAVYRSAQGTNQISNAILLCLGCHEACHSIRETREWAVKEAKRLAEGRELDG